MGRVGCVALVLATGCRSIFGLDNGSTAPDAAEITPDAEIRCFGTDPKVCIDVPTTPLGLDATINTDNDPRCKTAVGSCVLAGTTITLPAVTVAVRGTRPLILVATGMIDIRGTLDAASHHGTPFVLGPGANTACSSGAAPGKHGGGAGGSFGGLGGPGAGNGTDAGGSPGPVASGFRGGCSGQNAGSVTATTFGLGGPGGGAIALIADTIEVSGTISASGAGGNGGQCVKPGGTPCNGTTDNSADANGGGGGGSGGTIVLEATAITFGATAHVIADGGGGGEGSSHSNDGSDGGDPDGTTGGLGGAAVNNGGDGGRGAHDVTLTAPVGSNGIQSTSNPVGGGGGGGGGSGTIRVRAKSGVTNNGGIVSPAATP